MPISLQRLAAPALVAASLAVAACAGAGSTIDSAGFLAVWSGLDAAETEGDVCMDRFAMGDLSFGVRALACKASQAVDPAALIARAPVEPFTSGPHQVTTSRVDLALSSPNAFGRYDPAFVRWVTGAAIPESRAAVAVATPAYEAHVARLARAYWLAHEDLVRRGYPGSVPDGPLAAYAEYLDGAPVPEAYGHYSGQGFALDVAFSEESMPLLPDLDLPLPDDLTPEWEITTAYGFWLRRRADGTHAQWHSGLRRLLSTFDADWLSGQQA